MILRTVTGAFIGPDNGPANARADVLRVLKPATWLTPSLIDELFAAACDGCTWQHGYGSMFVSVTGYLTGEYSVMITEVHA